MNFSSEETSLNLEGVSDFNGATLVLSNHVDAGKVRTLLEPLTVQLRGWEGQMYVKH